jgi:alpha-mannosidase
MPAESRAGLKFNEVRREAGKRTKFGKRSVVDPEHPADHYVAAEVKGAGIAVFSRFPINYELIRSPKPRLAVCILRAVGMLSRNDMLTRGGGAGPDTLTPDAQCLRSFDMTFGIRPYDVAAEGAGLFAEAARWRSATMSEIIMGFEPTITDVPQGPQLSVDGGNVVVSALKVTHDRTAVVLRLHNASPERARAVVGVPQGRQVRMVGLDEQRVLETPRVSSEGRFSIDMNPWSLATVRIG